MRYSLLPRCQHQCRLSCDLRKIVQESTPELFTKLAFCHTKKQGQVERDDLSVNL